MKIFQTEQVKQIDDYTIKNEPIASINLMERAAISFIKWFMRKYDNSRDVVVYSGPGNNGGDGLAIARLLSERFFRVEVNILNFGSGYSDDFSTNLKRLQETNVKIRILEKEEEIINPPENSILIDAIFGSGLSRKVKGLPASAIKIINASDSEVVSVDIPSGLFGEDNTGNDPESIVRADYTITFEFPFLSFLFPENEKFTGKWRALSIGLHPEAIKNTATEYELSDRDLIGPKLKERKKFSHKGTFGHALIIAGCDGMMGASVLATEACLRTGVGLATAHLPRNSYNIMQIAVPEALVSIDQSDIIFTDIPDLSPYSAVAVGPGLNCRKNTAKAIEKLLKNIKVPLLIDADGLNMISANKPLLALLPEGTILTPHPKEFDRLFGNSATMYERHKKQLEVCKEYKIIIVLKGAHTLITSPSGHTYINHSGNSGMATGGSGDVLTGMIVSLLAQGYSSEDACATGVYLHGIAGDLALEEQSEESILPGDLNDFIGKAFKFVRNSDTN